MANTQTEAEQEVPHSPEPWDADGRLVFAGTKLVARCSECHPARYETPQHWTQEANARRIAAAVNACAGIPTEQLESGAIRTLVDAARELCQADEYSSFIYAGPRGRYAMQSLRAALAAFEGVKDAD